MAKKRRIVESESGRAARESEDDWEKEQTRRSRSFGDWARQYYARYWYAILSVAIDVFGGLQLTWSISGEVGTIAAIIFEGVAIVVEILVYQRLWPEEEEHE
ncbi:MAG: hypothetical protein LUO79_07105 [Methanomassiliicoccales archaeon]|nr:hypothetical protein [Methanomassiliicoccales archaeon]